MADYPCDLHLARYKGPSLRAYLNVYREDMMLKFKVTACEPCVDALIGDWLERTMHMDQEGFWEPGDGETVLECLWRPLDGPSANDNGQGGPGSHFRRTRAL